jgi:hypothetical protein
MMVEGDTWVMNVDPAHQPMQSANYDSDDMKLGLHTYTLHHWGLGMQWSTEGDPLPKEMTLLELMNHAVEWGIDGLHVSECDLETKDDDRLAEVREAAEARGLYLEYNFSRDDEFDPRLTDGIGDGVRDSDWRCSTMRLVAEGGPSIRRRSRLTLKKSGDVVRGRGSVVTRQSVDCRSPSHVINNNTSSEQVHRQILRRRLASIASSENRHVPNASQIRPGRASRVDRRRRLHRALNDRTTSKG